MCEYILSTWSYIVLYVIRVQFVHKDVQIG